MSCDFIFLSNYGSRIVANIPRVRFFPLLGTSKALSVCEGGGVGGHKTPYSTANMSKFSYKT
jgi:hypothetical protein